MIKTILSVVVLLTFSLAWAQGVPENADGTYKITYTDPALSPQPSVLSSSLYTAKIVLPTMDCNIPQLKLDIPLLGDAKCFAMDSVDQACTCLKSESYSFQDELQRENDRKIKEERGKKIRTNMTKLSYSSQTVGTLTSATEAIASGNKDFAIQVANTELNNEFSKTILKQGTQFFTGKGKKVEEASNQYLDYIGKYNSCIPFSEFTLINSLPKKSFVAALNDPRLTIEDFTQSPLQGDEASRKRRDKIKEFLHFNQGWEGAFKAGNAKAAFEAIKKIYKDVDTEKLYLSSANEREQAMALNKLEREKAKFFQEQNIASNYSKNSKRKKKEFESSVKIVTKYADYVDGNVDLLEKVVKFKGYPSIEDCRLPKEDANACQRTYANYCNVSDKKKLDPEQEKQLAIALEVVEDSHYIMDKYEAVTKRYCDKKMRIGNTSKINGVAPEAMSYGEFKNGLCKDKTFSIKGGNREILCRKDKMLMSLFANEIVDGSLIAKDTDADFEREFLQLYSSVEVNAGEDVGKIVSVALANGGNTAKLVEKIQEVSSKSPESNDGIFGNAEIVKEIAKTEKKNFGAQPPSNGLFAENKDIVKKELVDIQEPIAPAVKQVEKVVEQVTHLAGVSLNPEIAKNYSIASYIPPTTPAPEIQEQKTVVDSHVLDLEKRITALSAEKEVKAEADRKKEITGLEKEIAGLKEYSKSMEKLLDEKALARSEKETPQVFRQIASTSAVEDHGAAYVPVANALIPSKVYEGHFGDAAFHSQNPIGQSAMINRDISESKGSNEALMSVYANQSVKAMLDKGDTGVGNFILMSSPIEITESNEKKLLKRELQVDQITIDELRANPDKLRRFFEEKKIEHIGLLTLKSSSNMEVNYMVRRDEVGKLVVIPVNIARKSRLDDLKRTLQVQSSF